MTVRGRFCKTIVAPKDAFDRRSFRWVQSGRGKILIGCPRGHWRRGQCRVGTKAHEVLLRSHGRCRVGKVVRK